MSTQALLAANGGIPSPRESGDLSGEAQRIMVLVEAWSGVRPAISALHFEPLFATDPPGVLELALGELCRKHYLRRTDGWHYELQRSLAGLSAVG